MKAEATLSGTSVCVIIPVCNEAESLPKLRHNLLSLQQCLGDRYRTHFLFVDDGSTDGTGHLLPGVVPESASYEVRTHAQNRGVGAAFRTGFRQTEADIVCTIDADCSYGAKNLLQMIQEVECNNTDIIVASPYHPKGGVDGVQPWRLLLSSQCSRLYRAVSPLKLYTYTSIFRAYRGTLLSGLEFKHDDFIAAVELLMVASRRGYRISERPMILHRRSTGVSKMKIGRTIRGHLLLMLDCLRNRQVDSSWRGATASAIGPLTSKTYGQASATAHAEEGASRS